MKAALVRANGVVLHSLGDRLSYHLHHPLLLLGLAAYAVGTLLWIFAVSRKEISFLYPLTAANYAVIAIGGQLLFHESVSALRWAGIAVVMIGVILMNRSSQEAA
jgi:drug/metabolite transporter (DMT)-like permease